MEIKKFVSLISKASNSGFLTGFRDTKVASSVDKKIYKIYRKIRCRWCGSEFEKAVFVEFKKPTQLTIFQADLLYMLFAENSKPSDYAKYHKCEAGKKFIENINKVIVTYKYNNIVKLVKSLK